MTRKTKRCPLPARRSSKLITDDQDRCHLSPCRATSAIDRVEPSTQHNFAWKLDGYPISTHSPLMLKVPPPSAIFPKLQEVRVWHSVWFSINVPIHPLTSIYLGQTDGDCAELYLGARARAPTLSLPRLSPSSSFSWCGGPRQCHAYKLFDLSNFSENFFTSEAHDVIGWLKWLTKRQLLKFYYLISIAVIKVQRRSMH